VPGGGSGPTRIPEFVIIALSGPFVNLGHLPSLALQGLGRGTGFDPRPLAPTASATCVARGPASMTSGDRTSLGRLLAVVGRGGCCTTATRLRVQPSAPQLGAHRGLACDWGRKERGHRGSSVSTTEQSSPHDSHATSPRSSRPCGQTVPDDVETRP
jgi:hypothetical protein